MTLVVAAITKDFAFMACDHRHSLAGTVDKPVEVTIETEGGFNIRVSPPKVAIDIATKVFKSKAGALSGFAGDLGKATKYKTAVESILSEDLVEFSNDYFARNADHPEQLLILDNIKGFYRGIAYESIKSEVATYFTVHHIKPFENRIATLAIGSGSMIFQSLWNSSKDRTNIIYGIQREAGKIEQFREELKSRITTMFQDASKYDEVGGSTALISDL